MQRPHPTAEAAERAFYAAMAEGDLDHMMTVWAEDAGAVCNHPGGPRLVGLKAIRQSFREIFSNGGLRIDTTGVHAWCSADVAVHSLIERITVHGRGGSDVVEVIATNVFVRFGAGWRILVHHAGVAESAEAGDEDGDEEEEDDDLGGWSLGQHALERLAEGDDEDGAPEPDPMRPPPGRLH
jgi:ketosteroid isomerase-like protein